jgi:hypothetical protein
MGKSSHGTGNQRANSTVKGEFMPLYDDDELVSEVVTDFGNGRSLKIVLKDDAAGIPVARRLTNLYKQTASIGRGIEALEGQQAKADPKKFIELQKKIEEWRALPDEFKVAVDFLLAVGRGWDYYPNREAEERKEPYEFNEENVLRIKPLILVKVVQNIQRAIGLVEEEEDAKKPDVNSQEPSLQMVDTASSPTGTSTSATTAT